MKNVFLPLMALSIAFTLTLFLQACQKTDNPNSTSQMPASRQAQLLIATNAVVNSGITENESLTDVASLADSTDSTGLCAVVTFIPSSTVFPHQKIVDYGNGCTGTDGHVRKGKKIILVLTNPATAAPNSELSEVTFDNFYLDSVNITGVVKSYLISSSDPGPKVIQVVAQKSIFSPNGDRDISSSTHLMKQIEGGSTRTRSDDVYQISGQSAGTETLNGATIFTWTANTDSTNEVIKPTACEHRTKGALNITINLLTGGNATFTEHLDYGDGSCDDVATLSINGGIAQEVILPLLFWPLSL